MSLIERFGAGTLVRAAFCYEANFSHWAHPHGHELEVGRILHPAPHHEQFDHIGGIFHAANRFYLQVVEGVVECVDWYLERSKKDERHQNFRLISAQAIEQTDFNPGHLSFVGTKEQIYNIQQQKGERAFNPYHYDDEMVDALVALGLNHAP